MRRKISRRKRNKTKLEYEEQEFKDEDVVQTLDLIVVWSKRYNYNIQLHANILKDFFQKGK